MAGVLYLENTEATCAFTPDRIAVLELLAAQAAILLEKARLYGDLKEREARIRRLVDANIIGIVIFTLDGQIIEANEAFLAMAGYSREDLRSGRISYIGMTPPEWQAATLQRDGAAQGKRNLQALRKGICPKRRQPCPGAGWSGPVRGIRRTRASRLFSISPKGKRPKNARTVLLDELNHRVKNTLATVMAISAQTFRTATSPEAFREAFEGRLLALSQTHNLLNRSCWTGVSLRDILMQELAPYASGEGGRFLLDGDDLKLGPVMAVTLGMAFHELATNAAKYGALSVPGGKVRVAWQILRAGAAAPGVAGDGRSAGLTAPAAGLRFPPDRTGAPRRDLDGEVRLHFLSEGVRCSMDMPLDRLSMH